MEKSISTANLEKKTYKIQATTTHFEIGENFSSKDLLGKTVSRKKLNTPSPILREMNCIEVSLKKNTGNNTILSFKRIYDPRENINETVMAALIMNKPSLSSETFKNTKMNIDVARVKCTDCKFATKQGSVYLRTNCVIFESAIDSNQS